MSNLYEVIFKGEILDGADAKVTRQKVGAIFKANEAKVNALFSGKPITIKKNIDQETAKKFVQAFSNAGAKAYIKPLDQQNEPSPHSPAPTEQTKSQDHSITETESSSVQNVKQDSNQTSNQTSTQAPKTVVNLNAGNASNLAFESKSKVEAAPPPKTIVDIQPQSSIDDLSLSSEGTLLAETTNLDSTPAPEVPNDLTLGDNGEILAQSKPDPTPAPIAPDLEMEPMQSGTGFGKATFSLDP